MSAQVEVLPPTKSRGSFYLNLGKRDALYFALFALPYVAMLYFFSATDVYDLHFFDRSYATIYNLFRCIFIFYFFWATYFTGVLALSAADRNFALNFSFAERYALGFFVGAVLWQLLMFVLGYLSLYYRAMAVVLFSPFVFGSYFLVRPTIAEIRLMVFQEAKERTSLYQVAGIAGALALLLVLTVLLLVKGLYPAGGHDYWTHYFHFLTTALNNHGIWPNDVWYHYFFMKGAGSYFLAMLLADPLAPSLVVFCYVIAASFALFALIDGSKPRTWWPWAAIALYFFFYIHNDPAAHISGTIDAWGEFSKPHEICAAFFVVIVWTSAAIIRDRPNIRWPLVWGAAICCVGATYLSQPNAFIIGSFYLLLIVYAALLRNWRSVFVFFALGCATAAALLSLFPINYFTTGIPFFELLDVLWPFTNLAKIEHLGWTYDVLHDTCDRQHMSAQAFSFGMPTVGFLYDIFRLPILSPFIFYKTGLVLVSISTAVLLFWRAFEFRCWTTVEVVFLFVVATVLFAVAFGQTQDVSFFRYASFNLPIIAAMIALIWLGLASLVENDIIKLFLAYVVPAAAVATTIVAFTSANLTTLQTVVANSVRFADGSYSVAEAFSHQEGWPGRLSFGAIYPGALAAFNEVGPGQRIWTMNVHAYCMVPGCQMENRSSFVMSHRMLEVMLGSADRAADILKSEKLNYFLVSSELRMTDQIAASELFSPQHIAQHLGVRWTDGTTYLLTWLGPGVQPLTANFLSMYADRVLHSPAGNWSRHNILAKYQDLYDQLNQNPRPKWGSDLKLPWHQEVCG